MTNYQNMNHIPSEDEDYRYCCDCGCFLKSEELKESSIRRYEFPKCHGCMIKDEVKFEHLLERI